MTQPRRAMDALFEGEEVQEVLRESFYRPAQPAKVQPAKVPPKAPASAEPRRAKRPRAKPADVDYQVICISLYDEDLAARIARSTSRDGIPLVQPGSSPQASWGSPGT